MAKLQEKGEIPEEILRELETDVTGKILLASWRGTRFEVVGVLREVIRCVSLNVHFTDRRLGLRFSAERARSPGAGSNQSCKSARRSFSFTFRCLRIIRPC